MNPVESCLGLTPEAFERRLRIVRPILPDFVDRLEIRRLRVGTARVDLTFERTGDRIKTAGTRMRPPDEEKEPEGDVLF